MINHRDCDPLLRKSQDTTLIIIYIYNHIAMRRFLNGYNLNVWALFETKSSYKKNTCVRTNGKVGNPQKKDPKLLRNRSTQ